MKLRRRLPSLISDLFTRRPFLSRFVKWGSILQWKVYESGTTFQWKVFKRVIFLPILVYKRVSGRTSGLSLSVLNVFYHSPTPPPPRNDMMANTSIPLNLFICLFLGFNLLMLYLHKPKQSGQRVQVQGIFVQRQCATSGRQS